MSSVETYGEDVPASVVSRDDGPSMMVRQAGA
jgi:hypothetical protein